MKMKMALALAFCCVGATIANAQPLGVFPAYPRIDFVETTPGSVSYDPATQTFTMTTLAYGLDLSDINLGILESNATLQLSFQVDTNGNLISGTNGLLLTGSSFTDVIDGVTNEYSGTLLQGDVVAFGYLGASASGGVAQFDFRINLTGGQLISQFTCGDDLAITMSSEDSTFLGSFTNSFSGVSKGYLGPEDNTPPNVTCPSLSEVVTAPATNDSVAGFIVTYPDPIVTDNCDQNPTIYEDTPSGSFVQLNAGDSLTINLYGIDYSGNYNSCSFTVIMGATNSSAGGGPGGPCSLGWTDSGCEPTTLPTDTNMCVATYTFPLPIATNCMGDTFVATASALSESGNTIVLTNLGNDTMQGEFPLTSTTNGNIITFTASDTNGNQVVRQCQVFVQDLQPPTILCKNQAATFKPIVTNAFSCSSADFNSTCIVSNDYLWFSSVLQCPNIPRNCQSFTVHVFSQTINLAVDNTNITLNVPDAYINFSNGVPASTTLFTNGQWVTTAPLGDRGNTFISGLAWQVPFSLNNLFGNHWGRDSFGPFRCHVNSATWSGQFAVDTQKVVLYWQWGAVVESSLNTNCANLCVKPVDDNFSSCWKNSDPAGSCENFRSCLLPGATGRGCYTSGPQREQQQDCTGILSGRERCNLGVGTICEGAVDFQTPVAFDNCGNAVQVTCNPPSGSVFGPGDYTIECTAVDASGNTNECSFTLTVLAPIQIVFDSPCDDNIADNFAQHDSGFNDMNCPDQPFTTEYVNCFHPGDIICHKVRLLDCDGNDCTASLASCVTVYLDVMERCGSYTNSVLVNNLTTNSGGSASSPGCVMVPSNGEFIYNLNTSGYPGNTVGTPIFFRSCAWVEYNSSPGVPVGMEDAVLQSH